MMDETSESSDDAGADTPPDPAARGDAGVALIAETGFVQEGRVHLGLRLPDLAPREVCVTFKGSDALGETRLAWPGDFSADVGEDGLRRGATLPIETTQPFDEVLVSSPGLPTELGPGWHLRGLYAFSPKQFEGHFFRHRRRVKHAGSQIFALRQILDSYRLDGAHRAVAAVIYGYRAADNCDRDFLTDAKRRLREEIANSPTLSRTGHVRTDRDHLHLSMLMILWHVELELGEFTATLETLDEAIAYALAVPDPMAATAFNPCRMIFLRGMLKASAGDKAGAKELFVQNYHFYVRCMNRIEPNATHFTEMLDAHRAVALSLQSIERMAGGRKNFDRSTIFNAVNRVRSPAGIALLDRRLKYLFQKMKSAAPAT